MSRYSDARRYLVMRSRYDSPGMRELLLALDDVMAAPDFNVLKHDGTTTVGVTSRDGRRLVITRYNPNRADTGDMLNMDDICELLSIPLLAVIPESESVLNASNLGAPVVIDETSQAGQAYRDCVKRYLGASLPHRFLEVRKSGFIGRLFGR